MKICVFDNLEEISKEAFRLVFEQIKQKKNTSLGLATGSSPIGLYKLMIEAYRNNELDFSEVSTYNLDEYIGVPKENKNSYWYFMNENLFKHINIKKDNCHIPNANSSDIIKECFNYDKTIEKIGGVDIQILGIGRNGHIGFNEPGSDFKSKTWIVDLKRETIEDNSRFFKNKDLVPTKAITMGISTIMSAKKIILLAYGKKKQEAIKKMIYGEVTEKVPASVLQMHNNVTVLVDKDAAKLIE
ncbi:MAG: glucosamine-6-phosphate deaminase [Clostridiales bacterium]|nr:MAG: glucosamine-6-phosphate deaminase [Clostridiales bacterium]